MILVTGATGYIGKDLVKELRKKYKVKILTRRNINSPDVIRGNIRNYETLEKAMKDIDYVFHLAAYGNHFGGYKNLLSVNVEGTKNILKAAVKNNVKRIIYASSMAAVFKNPTNYGLSKKEAEKVVKKYSKKIDIVSLRPTIVYDSERLEILKKWKIFPKLGVDIKIQPVYKTSVVGAFLSAMKCKPGFYTIADKKSVFFNTISDLISSELGFTYQNLL